MIECDPIAGVDRVSVACREALRATTPSEVAPSKNSTFPPGVPPPGETTFTVAVTVTLWPKTDGLADEVTAVVVAATSTT